MRSWAVGMLVACACGGLSGRAAEPPRCLDDRLTVELFAEQPQVVTPTGLAIDDRGRVYVAESHTHFRPEDYDGPAADRILILEDQDGDGRADRRVIFHEGFVHVMDIECHRDGSLFVATRRDIHRLRDTNGDGQADEITLVVKLVTAGNYPHNGLSGLAFQFDDRLHFGLGENLGAAYELVGSDGTTLSGGGEGGSTYVVNVAGTGLRRTSTGWWNPFGMCVDALGRVFGTDNDPDASPPCRLIQVLDGGDYGYEFRYGRSGRHPLICWNGELPGSLPPVSGTGEAPCAIVAYEADAFPAEYRGRLLTPSWADHRVEAYAITDSARQGLVEAARTILVEGPDDFRPVGIDVSPDGSVYVSDWVSSSYTLHQQGRIWRIRPRPWPTLPPVTTEPRELLQSTHRRVRESAARLLASHEDGREILRAQMLVAVDPRVRASAIQALHAVGDRSPSFRSAATRDDCIANRVLAVRAWLAGGASPEDWLDERQPLPVRLEAVRHAQTLAQLFELLQVNDAAVAAVARTAPLATQALADLDALAPSRTAVPGPLVALLHRRRQSPTDTPAEVMTRYLASPDSRVRLAAVKWVADERLAAYEPQLQQLLSGAELDYPLFMATVAALDRLANRPPADRPPEPLLLAKIADVHAAVAVRRQAVRLLDPQSRAVNAELLEPLLRESDDVLRVEAVRTLARSNDVRRGELLRRVTADMSLPETVRAEAIAGLALLGSEARDLLLALAMDDSLALPLRKESLRSLVGAELAPDQTAELDRLGAASPELGEYGARLAMPSVPLTRPAATDTDAWLALLNGTGDPATGERLFFHARLGTCSRCHAVDGRGQDVGPDLSAMHRRADQLGADGRRWLLETILQPSLAMAPQFTPWQIETTDGQTYLGLPRRKGGNQEAYLGLDGREFVLKKTDIEFHRESPTSIMPAGLLQVLTLEELNHLFAFLLK